MQNSLSTCAENGLEETRQEDYEDDRMGRMRLVRGRRMKRGRRNLSTMSINSTKFNSASVKCIMEYNFIGYNYIVTTSITLRYYR